MDDDYIEFDIDAAIAEEENIYEEMHAVDGGDDYMEVDDVEREMQQASHLAGPAPTYMSSQKKQLYSPPVVKSTPVHYDMWVIVVPIRIHFLLSHWLSMNY